MVACYECGHDIVEQHNLTVDDGKGPFPKGVIWGGTCSVPGCLDRRRLDAFRWFFPTSDNKYNKITDEMMQEFNDYWANGGCQLEKDDDNASEIEVD
jgi:hypothetical protein